MNVAKEALVDVVNGHRRLGRGHRLRVQRQSARIGGGLRAALPRRHGRLRGHAHRNDPVRRGRRHQRGGRACLRLRACLPARAGASGQRSADVKPLITDTFAFADSVEAFDFAVNMPATSVKAQIEMG
ncbi:MAG: hypothetical protein R2838_17830 [Caldilineaceae bacterium]